MQFSVQNGSRILRRKIAILPHLVFDVKFAPILSGDFAQSGRRCFRKKFLVANIKWCFLAARSNETDRNNMHDFSAPTKIPIAPKKTQLRYKVAFKRPKSTNLMTKYQFQTNSVRKNICLIGQRFDHRS